MFSDYPSICACVRTCVPGRRHSPSGLLSSCSLCLLYLIIFVDNWCMLHVSGCLMLSYYFQFT